MASAIPQSLREIARGPRHATFATSARVAVPAVAFICATLLLILPFGDHPDFPYNWEDYTATRAFDFWDDPSFGILDVDGGLMTDSGKSPLVAIPVWLSWRLHGVGLAAMRLPLMLMAAAAVPLLWLLGKDIAGPLAGGLAAALLAFSPVFLFYGRTATNVALSLAPALLTIYVLLWLLRRPRAWRYLLALQVLLIAGVYAYAPIRFLWLMALGLIAFEMVLQPHIRRALIPALLLTAAGVPAFLIAATAEPPIEAFTKYYWGRGEHLLALREHPNNLRSHMAQEIQANPELAEASPDTLVRLKVVENAEDLLNLLVDRDTRPALTDYWNPHGRLYPLLLVPFILAGLAACAARALRRMEYRALLGLTAGFTLPMILTSNVHIGRLIFALPLLFLIAAIGLTCVVRGLLSRAPGHWRATRAVLPLASCLLVLTFGWLSWREYRGYTAPPAAWPWAAALKADARSLRQSGQAAAFVTTDKFTFEELHIDTLRLALDDDYDFIDVREPGRPANTSGKIPLYFGELLSGGLLASLGPARCHVHYFATSDAVPLLKFALSVCAAPHEVTALPAP